MGNCLCPAQAPFTFHQRILRFLVFQCNRKLRRDNLHDFDSVIGKSGFFINQEQGHYTKRLALRIMQWRSQPLAQIGKL